MKKLTRKLFLSVAALGACAATLVSTTFAWYTTNTSVDVTNVGALTEAAADGSQLYIAVAENYGTDKIADSFSEYTAVASPNLIQGGVTLTPVSHNGANGYQTIAKTTQNFTYTDVTLATGFEEGTEYFSRAGATYTSLGTATTVGDEIVLVLDGRDENVEFNFTVDYYVIDEELSVEGSPVYKLADIYGADNYANGSLTTEYFTMISDEGYTVLDTANAKYNKYNVYYVAEVDDETEEVTYRPITNNDLTVDEDAEYGYKWTTDTVYYVLSPATYAKSTMFVRGIQYYTRSRTTDTVTYADENATHFLEYVLRFRTTTENQSQGGMPIYVSNISVINTGFGSSSQIALQSGAGTGITNSGQLYNVDVLKAMKMDVYVSTLTNAQGESSEVDENGNAVGASDRTETYATYGFEDFVVDANQDVNVGTADAVGYYNKVTGAQINRAQNYANAGATVTELSTTKGAVASLFSIPQNNYYVEVRFVFYLDGWDEYCYDVCRQQGFQIAMSFSTEASENVLYKAA